MIDVAFDAPAAPPAKTYSVSALRDYHRCGHYYNLSRILKLPRQDTHHMAAGSLVHECFYLAYGLPTHLDHGRFTKAAWKVNQDNSFRPERALLMFDALWWGKLPLDNSDPELLAAHELLKQVVDIPQNFKPGATKALKGTQKELRVGYQAHFRKMLELSLEKPFDYPVVAIERRIEYTIGASPAVGYLDLVLQDPADNREIIVDLKSGHNKPSDLDLFFDEQLSVCYYQSNPKDIWYFHLRTGTLIGINQNFALTEWYGAVANETIRAIEAGYFPKRFSSDCVSCAYRTRCIGI